MYLPSMPSKYAFHLIRDLLILAARCRIFCTFHCCCYLPILLLQCTFQVCLPLNTWLACTLLLTYCPVSIVVLTSLACIILAHPVSVLQYVLPSCYSYLPILLLQCTFQLCLPLNTWIAYLGCNCRVTYNLYFPLLLLPSYSCCNVPSEYAFHLICDLLILAARCRIFCTFHCCCYLPILLLQCTFQLCLPLNTWLAYLSCKVPYLLYFPLLLLPSYTLAAMYLPIMHST
jgi:hypothetical protein